MLRKSLIALAATAAIGTAMASTAEAHHKHHHKHHGNIVIGLGGFGYGGGYYNNGFYDDGYYGGDCGWQYINVKKWNHWHTRYIIKHKKVWSCY